MSHFSVNIANIVLTNEQYLKLRIYAEANQISVHEAIRLLIDSLPEPAKDRRNLDKSHPAFLSRRFLHSLFNVQ
ncbi:hypothetical protein H6G41_27630 [Tolypothrix sp. FACHB-123]|uniref:hypothetical protein n=1 Tax=Tolypothrix sp. FACHB-123 TaxID=2692868 RepID=UPI0016895B62|nr:hypothetical protein [Tolypothrix sp. FACHB-123]MBD2358337.1 hypothetical protein [Tolypothrix sp. FACHB-123]